MEWVIGAVALVIGIISTVALFRSDMKSLGVELRAEQKAHTAERAADALLLDQRFYNVNNELRNVNTHLRDIARAVGVTRRIIDPNDEENT